MKKITDFIINKRYFILAIFVIFSIISVMLSGKVNINKDITKYLPDASETRIGMDIIDEEFSSSENSSSFYLMFKDLPNEEKDEIYNNLKSVEGVSSVIYDNTEKYNKDNNTLYVINVNDNKESELASSVYNEIIEKYKDYDIYTSGDIAFNNVDILPTWILVIAIISAIAILIIMCESYIEPFLFLITIFMAVILNNGTNIIFDSVSSVTSSISAILQMALSMDYSIMLMNRFRQEKETELDKIKAMKSALYNAFKSISSSSVTTIVGLLALIFMSFTIGRDLGLVLAKGVLLSLVTIFFVLPTLILISDKLIVKTKKKNLNIKLNRLGKCSYKFKAVLTILFIILFGGSYLVKGNLKILYTATELDEISKIFGSNNQIAVIYQNEYEENISKSLEMLEQKEKVDEVLAYSNTINEPLSYNELVEKLNNFGANIEIEDNLLKTIYYKYYNPNEDNKMTFTELYDFIVADIYTNDELSNVLDNETKTNIDNLKYFVKSDEIQKNRNASDISKILGIDKESVEDVLIYYNSKNNDIQISISEFTKFMKNDVLNNPKYTKNIDVNATKELSKLQKFTNSTTIKSKMTSNQIAELFGIDKKTAESLFMYYITVNEMDTKITLSEFANFVLSDVVTNPEFSSSFNKETINQLKMLKIFSDKNQINKEMTVGELSNLFGVNPKIITKLLDLKENKSAKATPKEIIELIISHKDNKILKNSINNETMKNIVLLNSVMESTQNNKKYTYKELSKFIGIEENSLKDIYTLYTIKNNSLTLTPIQFVNFILSHRNDKLLAENISGNMLQELSRLQVILDSVARGKKYNSLELSKLFGINKESMDLLYGLYASKYISANKKISLSSFTYIVLNDIMKNSDYKDNFDANATKSLQTINSIMSASVKGTEYTKDEIFTMLSTLNGNINKDTISILYAYYGSAKNYDETWKLTIEEFVDFLSNDILNDSRFSEFIESDMQLQIINGKETIKKAKSLLVGDKNSRVILNTKLDLESDETFNSIQDIKNILEENGAKAYVIGDSAMAYEMSKTFEKEFNYISVITMVAIFVVVAITFKSVILPLILVCIIQCAVYMTMGILSLLGGTVYFIAILIVQCILMGATIDYAIVYTSYYLESRETLDIKKSIIEAYNKSIHTILTSALILIIVTFIVGAFSEDVTARICKTLSEGTLCSSVLILILLPGILAVFDRFIVKDEY